MVITYIADVKKLPDPWNRPLILGNLSEERVEKVMRIRREHGRKQSLGAGLLLDYARQQLGPDLNYNLSHSGDYVICSASDKKVGADIEKIEEAPIKVAERYFCGGEVDHLNSLDEASRNQEFYRIWTIKESYMKMDGRGLSMGLKSFEVTFDDEQSGKVSIIQDGKKQECYVKEYDIDGYKLSVCSQDMQYDENIRFVEL